MRERGILGEALRTNWHLLAVLALILLGAAALALRPAPAPAADAATDTAVDVEVRTTLEGAASPEKSRWAKPTRTEKTQEAIEKYTHEVEYNVGSEETPQNLYRLANLYYSELHDFDKASLYYLRLIQDYPDYEAMQTVYANLVNCYEHLGQTEHKRNTLEEMKQYFGEGTQEYLFAEQQLNAM